MNRLERFRIATCSDDIDVWNKASGDQFKKFSAMKFEISQSGNHEFEEKEVFKDANSSLKMLKKELFVRLKKDDFIVVLVYTYLNNSNLSHLYGDDYVVSTSCHYSIHIEGNEDAFHEWLDGAIWNRDINLIIQPPFKIPAIDPKTGLATFEGNFGGRPTKMIIQPDGTLLMEQEGKRISFAAGNGSINLEKIKSVSIKNIIDLKEYIIKNTGDRVFHIFSWSNGGNGELTYGPSGKLEVFFVSGATVTVSFDNEILLEMNPSYIPS